MSRETERYLKKIMGELEKQEFDSEEEANEFLDGLTAALIKDGGFGALPEDRAFDEYERGCELMQSDDPEDEKAAIKHLKKAIKLAPPFYDARLMLLDAEADPLKRIAKLKELEAEAELGCLEDGGLSRDDVFGEAWYHIEMRPYMRIKHTLAIAYLNQGMYTLAKEKFEDALQWNENDNQGCRDVLMGLYAYFEDKEAALGLYQHYDEEQGAHNLLALAALHYRLNDEKSSRAFLRRLDKAVPSAFETLYGIIFAEDDAGGFDYDMPGYYRPGSSEEFRLAMENLDFLMVSAPAFMGYLARQAIDQHERRAKAKAKGGADPGSKRKPSAKKGPAKAKK
jgi:tetratricopeptide (TPR) repeat protein